MGQRGLSALEIARGADRKAQDAMLVAEKAIVVAQEVSQHLQTIGGNIAEMRRENTEQHRDNGAKMDLGFKELHTRVSSVKSELATVSNELVSVKGAVEVNKVAAAQQAADAKIGALKRVDDQVKTWKDGALKIMALTILGLVLTIIVNHYHIQVVLPMP